MYLLKRIQNSLFVVLIWYAACHILLPANATAEDKRPNILFIIADDQSPFDLQVYNPSSTLETPVISQLASDGMTRHNMT